MLKLIAFHRDMQNNYYLHFSPGKLLHGALFFTILFPFIPSIIPSADTQPTFTLLFGFSLLYVLVNTKYQQLYYTLTYNKILLLFLVFSLILASVILAKFFITLPTLWARIISFLQFVFAIFFAYNTVYPFKINTLKIVFWVFSIFSVIFFLSHGLVERILIPARNDSFEMLVNSGRGARTLSPEPSFFALHVFNLYIIFYLLATKESILKYGNIIFLLASFCLMISLSGYGFVIFLLIFFMRYTKISLTMTFLLILSSGVLISYLDSLQNFRGIRLLTTVLVENPMVLLNDASFLSRFGSFFAYLQNIKENYIIGDGFTLLQGGGFISIVSSLGIIAALFLIYILFEIFTLKKSGFKIKIILIFWFLINLFSGPIGIPTLGVIIGLILRKNHTGSGFNKFQNLVNA